MLVVKIAYTVNSFIKAKNKIGVYSQMFARAVIHGF